MIYKKTNLQDASIIDLEKNEDDRGFFSRIFCKKEFTKLGLDSDWVQINHSSSLLKGTLRGLHFQVGKSAETKLIKCISGSIWDVIVDLRKESISYGKWFGINLSAKNKTMLYVPKGFAHGFISLEDNSDIIYLVSQYYSKNNEYGLLWNDSDIGIDWPLTPMIISEKDRDNYSFSYLDKEIL